MTANAQQSFVKTNIVIDLSVEMIDGQMTANEIDFNQDGISDMRIYSWSNQSYMTGSGIEVQLFSDVYNFKGFNVDSKEYWNPCPSNPSNFNSAYAYLFRSDVERPSTRDYVMFPFRFTIGENIHFGVLHVLYEGPIVSIEGYTWNESPLKSCDCQTSNTSLTLGIDTVPNEFEGLHFKYYNLLGQEITDEPKGVVLKVYDNGQMERIHYAN